MPVRRAACQEAFSYQVNVAEAIAQRFALLGVEQCFSVTGGGAMFLNDAFARCAEIDVAYNHHEQASAMAAEGYARVANRPAIVNLTTGPGVINALTGVHGAFTDSIPMIIVSGQVKSSTSTLQTYSSSDALRQLGDQEAPTDRIVAPLVKHYVSVTGHDQLCEQIDTAYDLSISGRPGPVWLDVPIDVQQQEISDTCAETLANIASSSLRNISTPDYQYPPIDTLNSAVERVLGELICASRPLILLGGGLRLAGMISELEAILDAWAIPTAVSWSAIDAISEHHPCYAGRPSSVGDRCGNLILESSDLLIVMGCRLNIRQIGYNYESFASNSKILMIDIDKRELLKPTLRLEEGINLDLKVFLPALRKKLQVAMQPPSHAEYLERCKKIVRLYSARREQRKCTGLSVYKFIEKLSEFWRNGDVVVCGNGSACVATFQVAHTAPGVRIFTNSGSASMGYDLPAAIGASSATTERVWCLAGDGSIMMNIQELQTIVHHHKNIVVVLLENGGYASIRMSQQRFFSRHAGCDHESGLSFPDYHMIFSAFGLSKAGEVSNLTDLTNLPLSSLKGPSYIIAHLAADEDFAPKVAAKRTSDGEISSSSFADMSPHLDQSELTAALKWLTQLTHSSESLNEM